MQPFFSVVIPLYNKEKHIKKTIKSVLNQEFKDFEIIVVNDGSTDNSLKKVEELKDSRIIVYCIENQGVSHARNYGIKKAKSDYICFLDADDFWFKNHLINLKELLINYPKCGMYACAYQKKIENSIFNCDYISIPSLQKWSGILTNYFNSSLIDNIASASSVMIPKPIFETIGFFNINFNAGEDTDMWIRIALKHPIAFNSVTSVCYNLDGENRSRKNKINYKQFFDLDKFESFTHSFECLKKFLDLHRFSIGLEYKISGNYSIAKKYFDKIDKSNLNYKQLMLIKSPKFLLITLIKLQSLFRQYNLNLTAFR